MHADNPFVDEGDDGQVVKHGYKRLPKRYAVTSADLLVEAIDAGDALALVVAAEQVHHARIPDLECQQQAERLDTILATVHVITHYEDLLVLNRRPSDLEHLNHVVILAVEVAAHTDGRLELE